MTSQTSPSTPTIAQIAAEVGVSVPTVSKVLNGRADVAPGTRARVEAALARHRYKRRPRRTAAAGPPLLDLAFHELDSGWAIEIIRGVESTAAAAGVGVVLSELGGAHRPQQEWVDAVLARRPQGVILVLSTLGQEQQYQLESRSIPFVVVDTSGELPSGVPTVGSNNWGGGPALTTVDQQLRTQAVTATTMLLQLARGEDLALRRVELATDLVVRESTAP